MEQKKLNKSPLVDDIYKNDTICLKQIVSNYNNTEFNLDYIIKNYFNKKK